METDRAPAGRAASGRSRSPSDDRTEEALADALERVAVGAVAITTHALASAAGGSDLTFPQWRAILILGEDHDGARVGSVAARVGVTLPATSRLLHRLERRGLVTLAQDESDRRATRARLTGDGGRVRAAILACRRDAIEATVATIDATDRPALTTGLERIAFELERRT